MNKKWAAVLIPVFMMTTLGTADVDASWWSKTMKKLDKWASQSSSSSSSSSSGGVVAEPTANDVKSNRWIEVQKNQYYTTYVDRKSFKAEGRAQDRRVTAYFKRVYTPIGSQVLGNNSNGRVKPDVITHSIAEERYKVNSYDDAWSTPHYYDVHGNLIYEGRLQDYSGWAEYIPDSPEEQLKDTLFHMAGWDY